MRIPAARERVKVDGQSQTYLVVWIDAERQTADLIPIVQGEVLDGVPFSQICPMQEAYDGGWRSEVFSRV